MACMRFRISMYSWNKKKTFFISKRCLSFFHVTVCWTTTISQDKWPKSSKRKEPLACLWCPVVQKTWGMSFPGVHAHMNHTIFFHRGRIICVTGLRGYSGTELNNVNLINNHWLILKKKNKYHQHISTDRGLGLYQNVWTFFLYSFIWYILSILSLKAMRDMRE